MTLFIIGFLLGIVVMLFSIDRLHGSNRIIELESEKEHRGREIFMLQMLVKELKEKIARNK